VDLAQIGIRSRKVYAPNVGGRTGEHGNSADDASSEWHRKRTPVWKLVSAREVWWGKIGIESERQTVSLGINMAGRKDDATRQQLVDGGVEFLRWWTGEVRVQAGDKRRRTARGKLGQGIGISGSAWSGGTEAQ